jgi:hypothetical protein
MAPGTPGENVFHTKVRVNRNEVTGPGVSYSDAVLLGTADQISLHRCRDFQVIGNVSTDGGDGGITLAMQMADGVVADNVTNRNDTCGIYIGSGTTTYIRDISVTGNTALDNGQARTVTRGNRYGIDVSNGQNITVVGNTLSDTQAVPTQQYGLWIVDSDQITYGANGTNGNAVAGVGFGTGNTNLDPIVGGGTGGGAASVGKVKATATVRNNTDVFAADPELASVPVTAGKAYKIDMGLIIDSSTVADFKIQLTAPAGSTLRLTPNSFATTATAGSASGTINRSNTATTISLGAVNAGTDTTAMPQGSLIAGADGVVTLEWAQNTAEATDTRLEPGSWLILSEVSAT